jgi:hypothetical protein
LLTIHQEHEHELVTALPQRKNPCAWLKIRKSREVGPLLPCIRSHSSGFMDPLEDKLKISRPFTQLLVRPIGLNRRRGIAAITTFALVLSSGASSISDGQQSSSCIGVCNSTIVGVAVGISAAVATVAIIIAVNHHHHILKGCVFSGSNGPELRTSDAKTFALEGDAAASRSATV